MGFFCTFINLCPECVILVLVTACASEGMIYVTLRVQGFEARDVNGKSSCFFGGLGRVYRLPLNITCLRKIARSFADYDQNLSKSLGFKPDKSSWQRVICRRKSCKSIWLWRSFDIFSHWPWFLTLMSWFSLNNLDFNKIWWVPYILILYYRKKKESGTKKGVSFQKTIRQFIKGSLFGNCSSQPPHLIEELPQ